MRLRQISLAIVAGAVLVAGFAAAAAAAQQPITGPLRVVGQAGQTVTLTYTCSVPPAGAMWGVGNDGNGTITNIDPVGGGVFKVKLIRERESVWISNPNGQCASIQVRIIGHAPAAHRYRRPYAVLIGISPTKTLGFKCHNRNFRLRHVYGFGGCKQIRT